eukprot:238638-Rhodomonas_salina.2
MSTHAAYDDGSKVPPEMNEWRRLQSSLVHLVTHLLFIVNCRVAPIPTPYLLCAKSPACPGSETASEPRRHESGRHLQQDVGAG